MQDADLVFYVKLELKPECVEEWKAAVVAVIEQMSREPAFVSCSLQQDIEEPTRFTLYERWREPSVEAFIKNQFEGKDYRQEYEARLPGMLRTPRAPTVLRHIQEWRAP
ncbi:MAG TPA: antibiotic biosynthesis monooxygenase family protein [Gemmatimonadaceae bacterium]|nr:antibiotic biosynthesis monooxygenase family protein [Gemmatimonadaceae bacterium]